MFDVDFGLLCARISPIVGIKLMDVIFEWRVRFLNRLAVPFLQRVDGIVIGLWAWMVPEAWLILLTLIGDPLKIIVIMQFSNTISISCEEWCQKEFPSRSCRKMSHGLWEDGEGKFWGASDCSLVAVQYGYWEEITQECDYIMIRFHVVFMIYMMCIIVINIIDNIIMIIINIIFVIIIIIIILIFFTTTISIIIIIIIIIFNGSIININFNWMKSEYNFNLAVCWARTLGNLYALLLSPFFRDNSCCIEAWRFCLEESDSVLNYQDSLMQQS